MRGTGAAVEARGKRERARGFGGLGKRLRQRRGEAAQVARERHACRARAAGHRRCARRRAIRASGSSPRARRSTACARSGASAAPCRLPAAFDPRAQVAVAEHGGRDGCLPAAAERAAGERRAPRSRDCAPTGRPRCRSPRSAVGGGAASRRPGPPCTVTTRRSKSLIGRNIATSACTGPVAASPAECGAEGRRERRRLQHADRAARVGVRRAARGEDRFAQVAAVDLRVR